MHYSKTLEAWLVKQDTARKEVMGVLRATYGDQAYKKFHDWRMFFIFCSESFKYANGSAWMVSQYTFRPAHGAK